MAVTRERFEQGLTYEMYKAQMTRNQDPFIRNEEMIKFTTEDIKFFKQLPPLNVLVLAEDWCGDVIANLPVLGRLAAESGTLNVRVFLRDENADIMDQYLNAGEHRSIPVFVFFDEQFRELGYWIERPALVSELYGKLMDQLHKNDPAFEGVEPGTPIGQMPDAARLRMSQAFSAFREQYRDTSTQAVVQELRTLLENNLARSS
jgi:hypothetical protein